MVKITDEQLEKINAIEGQTLSEDEVYVFTINMTGNNLDKDYEMFSVGALKQLAEMYIGKPLKYQGNIIGRIFNTYLEVQEDFVVENGERYYRLKADVYSVIIPSTTPIIKKIKEEVCGKKSDTEALISISCSVDEAICSICGENRRKRNNCEHINSQLYNNSHLCYVTLQNVTDVYEAELIFGKKRIAVKTAKDRAYSYENPDCPDFFVLPKVYGRPDFIFDKKGNYTNGYYEVKIKVGIFSDKYCTYMSGATRDEDDCVYVINFDFNTKQKYYQKISKEYLTEYFGKFDL
jgi:hypothetical protein